MDNLHLQIPIKYLAVAVNILTSILSMILMTTQTLHLVSPPVHVHECFSAEHVDSAVKEISTRILRCRVLKRRPTPNIFFLRSSSELDPLVL